MRVINVYINGSLEVLYKHSGDTPLQWTDAQITIQYTVVCDFTRY